MDHSLRAISPITRHDVVSYLQRVFLSFLAVGCSNLIPPEDAWIKREDNKIIIGCYTSRQTWQLHCHDGRWTGVVSNCSHGGTWHVYLSLYWNCKELLNRLQRHICGDGWRLGLVARLSRSTKLKPNSITLSCSKLASDQLRTCFEQASVMEFGYYSTSGICGRVNHLGL